MRKQLKSIKEGGGSSVFSSKVEDIILIKSQPKINLINVHVLYKIIGVVILS